MTTAAPQTYAPVIRRLESLTPVALEQLVELLVTVVEDGASIGFLPPLDPAEARHYWRDVLNPGVCLYVAERDSRITGSVQLHLSPKPNASHRTEVAKLMVHPEARGAGLGGALMRHAEARRLGRSLLVLDTRAGDIANHLYRSLGYAEAGRIPRYVRSANGALHETVIYYKELA